MTYGEAPPEPDFSLPEEAKNLVMYTALDIGGAMVMFCDLPPDACLTLGNQINPVFSSTDVKEVQNVFARLAEGGTIEMPLAKTFFSPLYGMVTDKYGITWQIDAETGEAKDS